MSLLFTAGQYLRDHWSNIIFRIRKLSLPEVNPTRPGRGLLLPDLQFGAAGPSTVRRPPSLPRLHSEQPPRSKSPSAPADLHMKR